MAAAAITVHVGSISDPADLQGLAHLIEHMLFQGSKKFPSRGELDKFIHSHGGYSNAYTSLYQVLVHLEIPFPLLRPSLARLADAFTAPLMDPAYVREEIEVIQSEYDGASMSDFWRVSQILRKVQRNTKRSSWQETREERGERTMLSGQRREKNTRDSEPGVTDKFCRLSWEPVPTRRTPCGGLLRDVNIQRSPRRGTGTSSVSAMYTQLPERLEEEKKKR